MIVLALLFAAAEACSQAKAKAGAAADSALKVCKEMYAKDCAACHGERGQGTIGPNLSDKFWIHGGERKQLVNTIKEGVTGKGMISWEGVLTPEQIQQVSDYILTLQGTNPPKAKKPEGKEEGVKEPVKNR
jgi:cytochrome c oxidase cbb3-type subunit 3